MKSTADTARKALEVLDSDGWCKGFLTFGETSVFVYTATQIPLPGKIGSHCIGGAVNIAMSESSRWLDVADEDYGFYAELADLIREQYPEFDGYRQYRHIIGGREIILPPPPVSYIAMWNNDKDRTEEEVRRILEKLAAKES